MGVLASTMLALTVLAGCGSDLSNQVFLEDAEFLAALPSRDIFQVEYVASPVISEPEEDILLLQTTVGAIDNADDWLELTASITDAMRDLVPAVRKSNYREWGPYEYEFIGTPAIYLTVEVTRSGNGASYTYNYYYSTSAGAGGERIRFFVGRHYIGETIEEGDGSMTWQLGAIGGSGEVTVDYDLRDEMVLLVTLDSAAIGGDGPFRAQWYFQRQPDGGGELEYYAWTDFNPSDGAGEEELMAVRTRWLADGSGRADADMTDGDLFADYDAALVQCWTETGALTAQSTDPVGLVEAVGDPERDCPFGDAASIENLPEY